MIVGLAILSCVVALALFRVSPNDAAAEARSGIVLRASKPVPHIRIVPLYKIPAEQAVGP